MPDHFARQRKISSSLQRVNIVHLFEILVDLSKLYDEQSYNLQDFSAPQKIFYQIENATAIWLIRPTMKRT